jgi:hypothetical protein
VVQQWGQHRGAVKAEAVRLGAEPSEAAELVDGLVADGLLRASERETDAG